MVGAPEVSIVICHHVGTLLERCLASVSKTQGVTYEVIVLTSTGKNFAGTTTIAEPGGPAHKRNVGVAASRGEYIVFLDDDLEITAYTIWHLVEGLRQRPRAAMAFCKILKMDDRRTLDDAGSWLSPTGFLWARAGDSQLDRGQFDQPCRILSSKSATCIVDKHAFYQAGGFDRAYFILGEETDLAWRCWLFGYEVWYEPSAISYHAFGTALKPTPIFYEAPRIFLCGPRNYVSMLCTNLGALRLCAILPVHLLGWLVAAGGFCCRGQWRRGLLILRGLWGVVARWQAIWRKRQHVQGNRVISDRALWPMIARWPGFGYYLQRMWRYQKQGLHG